MGPVLSLYIYFAMRSQLDHSLHKWDKLCHSGSLVADDWRLGGLWDVEVRRGQNFPGMLNRHRPFKNQAEYFDFFHHSAGGRLVCMARRSRPIPMASRRRFVYPWQ
jgi:hypothetical protein